MCIKMHLRNIHSYDVLVWNKNELKNGNLAKIATCSLYMTPMPFHFYSVELRPKIKNVIDQSTSQQRRVVQRDSTLKIYSLPSQILISPSAYKLGKRSLSTEEG